MFTRLNDIDRLFGSMSQLRSRLNNLYGDLDRSYDSGMKWAIEGSVPRTNLYENGDNFEIRAEVPGMDKADMSVKIQGNYLEISGCRSSDVPEGYKIHKTERGMASFSRSFTLPAEVDATKADATLKNGVLYLMLPKAEAAKPKKIAVN